MKLEEWFKNAARKLKAAGISSARLDCLILVEDLTGKDRSYLLAHPELKLSSDQIKKLDKQIIQRAAHEPLAYIRGFTEFYGRRFKINRHVLEPRPESETMIDLLKQLPLPRELAIADIGTGSGALGITAKLEIHDAEVDLYDIDSSVLAVARHNAVLHELHLHCYKRDLLNQPAREYDVILANLPYVPVGWKINQAAAMEPRIAIFGGKDGLDLYRRLFEQLKTVARKPQFVLTESLPPQHQKLSRIAANAGYKVSAAQDLIQVFVHTAA